MMRAREDDPAPRRGMTSDGLRRVEAVARAWEAGDLERAEADAAELAEVGVSPLEIELASRALAALGAPRAALRASERAVAIDPHAPHATRWRFTLLVALGYTHRAREIVLGANATDPAFDALGARVLAWIGDAGAAARLGVRAIGGGAEGAGCAMATSTALEELGRREEAARIVAHALGGAEGRDKTWLSARLLALGDADGVEAVARGDDELAHLAAEIALWRGDDQAFEAALARTSDDAGRARLRAARLLGRREFDGAAKMLASADPADPVVCLIGAELALREGRAADAMDLAVRASNGSEDSTSWAAAQALQLLSRRARTPDANAPVGVDGLETLVRAVLDLVPDHGAPPSGERADGPTMQRDVEALLARLGPNRTPWTYVREASGQLRPWFAPASIRRSCILAQRELRWRSLEAVLASFDDLGARALTSFHVRAYRGEVLLWAGRYDEAFAHFERAALEGRRWPPIGAGASMLCLGRAVDARRWLDLAARHAAGPGPPWYAWEGEWQMLHGSVAAARERLGSCLHGGSRRLGALVAQALLAARHGPVEEADGLWRLLVRRAPLLLEAGAELAARRGAVSSLRAQNERAEVLARARDLMRGNRSSNLPSFDDGRGELVFEAPEEWRDAIALDASAFARLVASRSARGSTPIGRGV